MSKKFVRQEAMEKDDASSSKDSFRNQCHIKVTSGDDIEIFPNDHQSNEESEVRLNHSIDRGWSTTSQQNSESDDDFSLVPDRSLSRSSEATSDQESLSSESLINSVLEEFEVKQVELGKASMNFSSDNIKGGYCMELIELRLKSAQLKFQIHVLIYTSRI